MSFLPISEISSYQQRWTICGRVTSKSDVRNFSRGANPGKVFSVDLLDEHGGEIRASFWNQTADAFYPKLEKGKCYSFSGGSVKVANRQFNAVNHRYELHFERDPQVAEVVDDSKIGAIKFNFVDLRTASTVSLPHVIDICGIVTGFQPTMSFTSKDGKELVKREITVADDSAMSVAVTLWGEKAKRTDEDFKGNPVVCLKGVAIKEYQGGRSGSSLAAGEVVFGAASSEAQKMQQWWSQGGSTQSLTPLSQEGGGGGAGRAPSGLPVSLEELRIQAERVTDKPEIFTAVCRLAMVQTTKQGEAQPLYYMACQEPKEGRGLPCNRRLDASGVCPSCQRAGKAAARMFVRCRFSDCSDSLWLSSFNEAASVVLGMSPDEVMALEKGPGGRDAVEAAIRKAYFGQPVQVTVRAKLDSYNGEPRTNTTCIDARPVARGVQGRAMLKEIEEMLMAAPAKAGC